MSQSSIKSTPKLRCDSEKLSSKAGYNKSRTTPPGGVGPWWWGGCGWRCWSWWNELCCNWTSLISSRRAAAPWNWSEWWEDCRIFCKSSPNNWNWELIACCFEFRCCPGDVELSLEFGVYRDVVVRVVVVAVKARRPLPLLARPPAAILDNPIGLSSRLLFILLLFCW